MSLCLQRKALPSTPEQRAIHQREILELTGEVNMQIGESLRTIVVEPLELPVDDPQTPSEPEPAPQPEPEQVPAKR